MYSIEFTPEIQRLYEKLNRGFVAHASGMEDVKTAFEAQARQTPDRVALRNGKDWMTYAQLDARAGAIAGALYQAGVRAGNAVLVDVPRSMELVAALLGVVKCAAIYVPLGADWPAPRIALLAEETGANVMLSDGAKTLPHDVQLIEMASLDAARRAPDVTIRSNDVIYVNFTSGSTGKPKAVPILHQGVMRLVRDMVFLPEKSPLVTLHLSPITFDAATFEIWAPLVNGGTCVIYPHSRITLSNLRKALEAGRVNALFLTTALFNTIIDVAPQTLDKVGTILTGGEAHSARHISAAVKRYGEGRVVNVYGPTECTTFASFHPIDAVPDRGEIPLGSPIQKTGIYILDGTRACGVGEIGAIHITGPGVSPGYLNAPEKTARYFKRIMINGEKAFAYDTGDLGRLSDRNEILFEGRADDQLKINGHRIEPGEIAYHLNAVSQVRQSFVAVNTTPAGEKQLIAFVIPKEGAPDPGALTAALELQLPAYMTPKIVIHDGEFPLTQTNKIDRAKLLAGMNDPGAPLKKSARKIQNVLNVKGANVTVIELPGSTRTAEDAARALNCQTSQIVKTLIFRCGEKASPLVVLVGGSDKVDTHKLARLVGGDVKQASAKYVKENIGFAVGGVPPVGHATKTRVVVDESLSQRKGVWAAAGAPNAVFNIPGEITSILDDYVIAQIKDA